MFLRFKQPDLCYNLGVKGVKEEQKRGIYGR